MKVLPVVLDDYRLTVVDPPMAKTREDDDGNAEMVTDPEGPKQYVVSLFAKQLAERGQWAPKGEEITVTLPTDPGAQFEQDVQVELIGPVINLHSVGAGDHTTSRISFQAIGMTLRGHSTPPRRREPVNECGTEAAP